MNKFLTLSIGLISLATSIHAQKLEKLDLSESLGKWKGDGELVVAQDVLENKGSPSEKSDLPTDAVMIRLHPKKWTLLEQRLRPKSEDNAFAISLEVLASEDFEASSESRTYTTGLGWGKAGQYLWSSEVFPKTDFLIRLNLSSERWHYNFWQLKQKKQWRTYTASFEDLRDGKRTVTIEFPPGKGFVLLKNIE